MQERGCRPPKLQAGSQNPLSSWIHWVLGSIDLAVAQHCIVTQWRLQPRPIVMLPSTPIARCEKRRINGARRQLLFSGSIFRLFFWAKFAEES